MKLDKYSLDTHSLVWYFLKQKTLSFKAEEVVRKIFNGEALGIVSTMVVLEAFYVSFKIKRFDFPKFLEVLKNSNIKIISFDKEVLAQSFELPAKMDIHDRIIVATAIFTNTPLVTKDKILRSNFPIETIW